MKFVLDCRMNHSPVDGRYTAEVGVAVAVVIARHRHVAGSRPHWNDHGRREVGARLQDVPDRRRTGDTPPGRSCRRRRNRPAPARRRSGPTDTGGWGPRLERRIDQIPVAGVNTAASVLPSPSKSPVTGRSVVAAQRQERLRRVSWCSTARLNHVPTRRAIHGEIRLAVAVEIAGAHQVGERRHRARRDRRHRIRDRVCWDAGMSLAQAPLERQNVV